MNLSSGISAFKTGFYAFANQQGCVMCHNTLVHPQFANSDVNVAYSEAKGFIPGTSNPLVNFQNPDAATFVTYSSNSHCGETPCQNPNNANTVKNLIRAWAQAERAGSSPTTTLPTNTQKATYLTAAVPVPAKIPSINMAPVVYRFQLSALKPAVAVLSNAVFEVEIQYITSDTYRISRPKIAGNTAAVKITGIHVYVKTASRSDLGDEDINSGNLWDIISITAPVFTLPNTLPTGPLGATPLDSRALNIPVQSTTDVMTIGFDAIM